MCFFSQLSIFSLFVLFNLTLDTHAIGLFVSLLVSLFVLLTSISSLPPLLLFRSLSSIIGWVLVCIGIHEENQNGRRLLGHCSSLRMDLEKQKVRLQNMSGKHLDSASPDELEDLVLIQRAAVKSTERAIEFYRKRTEARGGRASPSPIRGGGVRSPASKV